MYWNNRYEDKKCYPYFTDGVIQYDDASAKIYKISDSSCA